MFNVIKLLALFEKRIKGAFYDKTQDTISYQKKKTNNNHLFKTIFCQQNYFKFQYIPIQLI